jgi:uroporphyrin-III C-methyltransferase
MSALGGGQQGWVPAGGSAVSGLPTLRPGTVWLVGAGPGDAGLLTRLAVHALEQADVVLHDALIGADIFAFTRADVRLEAVGKRAGRLSARQEDINARLVTLAREGLRVVRLKGGDPFTFGRGGEEALALAQAGIAFRVVPGITAGIGGSGVAGIPVSHRGLSGVVSLITASDKDGGLAVDLDWDALARSRATLVFYMGLRLLGDIVAHLLAAGLSVDVPVAVVSRASLPEQKIVTGVVGDIVDRVALVDPAAPAIITIGSVVGILPILSPFLENLQAEHTLSPAF